MDRMTPFKTVASALGAKLDRIFEVPPCILRITSNENEISPADNALLIDGPSNVPRGFGAYFSRTHATHNSIEQQLLGEVPHYLLPETLNHLEDGDIVRLTPSRGELWVMYRRNSLSNAMLVTERCNSWCVMCSQPPKKHDSVSLVDDWLAAIPMMSNETQALGITGGEPTLLGDRFIDLVSACARFLPKTALHVLSNGRMFAYLSLARELAEIRHPDLMIGIPVYSDISWRHEFVVQAPGSFDHTVRGILNLARCKVPVEIRVVIHRHTYARLPQLASYIARNFPFVSHVALMGFEPIGFGKTNLRSLWIDPIDYQVELTEAVTNLAAAGLNVSIYNHQLCVLPKPMWAFARKSISDWKNIFLPECEMCSAQPHCGGFFHSATSAHSSKIRPFTQILSS